MSENNPAPVTHKQAKQQERWERWANTLQAHHPGTRVEPAILPSMGGIAGSWHAALCAIDKTTGRIVAECPLSLDNYTEFAITYPDCEHDMRHQGLQRLDKLPDVGGLSLACQRPR